MPVNHSLIEFAVTSFSKLLFGGLMTPGEDFVIQDNEQKSHPTLFSQTVPGQTLQEVFDNPNDCETLLANLHPQSTSAQIITAMLTHPEDGRPDNYTVMPLTENETIYYRIIPINNNLAFVDALNKDKRLQVKTVLFCLDEMQKPMHPTVRERLLSISPDAFLRDWLEMLHDYQAQTVYVFDNSSKKTLALDERLVQESNTAFSAGAARSSTKNTSSKKETLPSHLLFPCHAGIIITLWERFHRLQEILHKTPNITHLALLKQVSPALGFIYEKSFEAKPNPLDAIVRFDETCRVFCETRRRTRMTISSTMSTIRLPKEQLLAIQNQVDNPLFKPEDALHVLEQLVEQVNRQEIVIQRLLEQQPEAFFALNSNYLKAMVVNQLNFNQLTLDQKPDIAKQRYLITIISKAKIAFQRLVIKNCDALTDTDVIELIQYSPELIELELLNCSQLTDNVFNLLAQNKNIKRYLMTLRICECHHILNILPASGWFKQILTFQALQQLCVDNNPHLKQIVMECPKLTHASIQHNPELERVELRGDKLQALDARFCEKFTDKALEETTYSYTKMPRVLLQNTSINNVVLLGMSYYAPELMTIFSPKECFFFPTKIHPALTIIDDFNPAFFKEIDYLRQYLLQTTPATSELTAQINTITRDYIALNYDLFVDLDTAITNKKDLALIINYWQLLFAMGTVIPSEKMLNILITALKEDSISIRACAAEALGKLLSITFPHQNDTMNALIIALKDEYSHVRFHAIEAIRELPVTNRAEVIKALAIELKAVDSSLRVSAAQALVELGQEEAYRNIINTIMMTELQNNTNWRIRNRAVEILSKLSIAHREEVMNTLVTTLQDNHWCVRARVAETLGKISLIHYSEIINALVRALKDPDPDVCTHVLESLIQIGQIEIRREEVISVLTLLLKDKDLNVRAYAAIALVKLNKEKISHDDIINALIEAIKNQYSFNEVRACAVTTLALLGKEELRRDDIIPTLVIAFQDEEYYVRTCAAHALIRLGEKKTYHIEIINALIKLLANRNQDIRANAAKTLSKLSPLHHDEIINALVATFNEPHILSRFIGQVLLQLGQEEAYQDKVINALIKELKGIAAHASRVIQVLAQLGQEEPHKNIIIDALVKALLDDSSSVRAHAAWTLGYIPTHRNDVVSALIRILREDNEWSVRYHAAEALGSSWAVANRDDAIDALVKALKDKESSVRSKTAYVLGKLPIVNHEKVINALVATLKDKENDKYYTVRSQAATAVSKLLTVYRYDIIDPIVSILKYKYSGDISTDATESLARLGQVKAYRENVIDALVTVLKDRGYYEHIRACAANALSKLPVAHRNDVIHALIIVLQKRKFPDKYKDICKNATKTLGKLPIAHRDDVIDALKMIVEERSVDYSGIRPCAIWALVQLRKEEAHNNVPRLLAILQNDFLVHDEEYLWAAETLARLAEEGVYHDNIIHILLMQFEDKYSHRYYRSDDVRISAVKALAILGQVKSYRDQVINALITVLKNDNHYHYDNDVYIYAVDALGKLPINNRDDIIQILVSMLKNKDLLLRWNAAVALARLGAEDACRSDVVNTLASALKSKILARQYENMSEIHVNVVETLGELSLTHRDDIIDTLVTVFMYGDSPYDAYYDSRAHAAETLVKLGREEAHQDKIIDVLITTLKNKKSPIRARTIEALRHAIERISINDTEIQSPPKLLHYQFTKYLSHHGDKIHSVKKTSNFLGSPIFSSQPVSTDLSSLVTQAFSSSSTSIGTISRFTNRLSFHSSLQTSNSLETSAKPTPKNNNDKGKEPEDDLYVTSTQNK